VSAFGERGRRKEAIHNGQRNAASTALRHQVAPVARQPRDRSAGLTIQDAKEGRPEPSGKQIRADRRELHVGSGVMQFQPTPFYGEF
jgi:hypothetical protein